MRAVIPEGEVLLQCHVVYCVHCGIYTHVGTDFKSYLCGARHVAHSPP